MRKTQTYRGVRSATLITVCEGDGTPESPWKLVDYVLLPTTDGRMVTYGKVTPLSLEEKEWIGNDELSH